MPFGTRILAITAATVAAAAAAAAQNATPALRLPEVYAEAEARNARVRAADAAAAATGERESLAATLPDPELQIGAMNVGLPDLRADMPGSMVPSIQLMQMVPTAGKRGLSARIARQDARMAEQAAAELRWETRAAAAMAFFEIYEADRQRAVMEETLALLRTFEEVARSMYAAGSGRQSDVLRAGVEVTRMEAEVRRMAAMRRVATARLNAILNRPAASPFGRAEVPHLPASLPPLDTLLGWADATRPMLARGRVAVEQAGTRRRLAAREIWPDVTVGLQYGQRGGEEGTERMGSVMLGASLPVFAGRRQHAMRREAEAMEGMAVAELDGMRARVAGRIGEILARLDNTRELATAYRTEVLPQAEANVESALASYRAGAVDFMTLVEAQMRANEYRQELTRLVAAYGTLMAELEMEVGRALPSTDAAVSEER